MLDFSRVRNYYIACGYTDMRRQIDGLVATVQLQFGKEMDEASIFLFCGRRADRIKALYFDGTGYVLLYKRLTEKRFQWPRNENELNLPEARRDRDQQQPGRERNPSHCDRA